MFLKIPLTPRCFCRIHGPNPIPKRHRIVSWKSPWFLEHTNRSLGVYYWSSNGCFQKIGIPQNGWFIMENPIKMGWFGYPYFRKHPNLYLFLIYQLPTWDMLNSTFYTSPKLLHSTQRMRHFRRCLSLVNEGIACQIVRSGWRSFEGF